MPDFVLSAPMPMTMLRDGLNKSSGHFTRLAPRAKMSRVISGKQLHAILHDTFGVTFGSFIVGRGGRGKQPNPGIRRSDGLTVQIGFLNKQ